MSYLVIVRGPLGVGKTTIAKQLAKEIRGEYFSVDRIIEEYELGYDVEDGNISQASFLKTNEILAPLAKKSLEKGDPVVFDGNFYWPSHIEDLIERLGVKSYIFDLRAPLDVCVERDKYREKTYGEAAAQAVYKRSVELDYGNIVDAEQSEKDIIKEIVKNIEENKKNGENAIGIIKEIIFLSLLPFVLAVFLLYQFAAKGGVFNGYGGLAGGAATGFLFIVIAPLLYLLFAAFFKKLFKIEKYSLLRLLLLSGLYITMLMIYIAIYE